MDGIAFVGKKRNFLAKIKKNLYFVGKSVKAVWNIFPLCAIFFLHWWCEDQENVGERVCNWKKNHEKKDIELGIEWKGKADKRKKNGEKLYIS